MAKWTEWNVTSEQVEEQVREEVRKAVDKYLDQYLGLFRKTVSSYPLDGTELGTKAKDCAEENVAIVRDYLHKLSLAKDFLEVVPIQTEFMQAQFKSFGRQVKSLGEAYTKAAKDLLETPIKTTG